MNNPLAVTGELAISELSRVAEDSKYLVMLDGNGVVRNMRPILDEVVPYLLGVDAPPRGQRATRAYFEAISPDVALAYDDLKKRIHEEDFVYDAPAITGAFESMLYLREHECGLTIVTSRDTLESAVMASWLKMQSEKRFIDGALVHTIIASAGRPKDEVVGAVRFHAAIDDSYGKIANVRAAHKYVFGNSYEGPPRAGVHSAPRGWLDERGDVALAKKVVRNAEKSYMRLVR